MSAKHMVLGKTLDANARQTNREEMLTIWSLLLAPYSFWAVGPGLSKLGLRLGYAASFSYIMRSAIRLAHLVSNLVSIRVLRTIEKTCRPSKTSHALCEGTTDADSEASAP